MRLPNGYGSVTKLSGNRRRPFMVKKTIGYDNKGHPIIDIIGYAETKQDGLQLLAEYNGDPYDVDKSKATTKEVIDGYKASRKYIRLTEKTKKTYETYIRRLKPHYNKPYRQLTGDKMQRIVDNESSYSTQGNFRNVLKNMDDYAIRTGIITNGYAQSLYVDKAVAKRKSQIFTEKEIETLWDNYLAAGVMDVLIMIYTGFRISGLYEMKIENIDLEQRTMKGGVKTEAGKDRIVPIHPSILPLVQYKVRHATGQYLLYSDTRKSHTYATMKKVFDDVMEQFNMEHIPHDTRHTFRSRLDNAGANKTSIDLLMGHTSSDIGERVYTHKTIDQLREAVHLLD